MNHSSWKSIRSVSSSEIPFLRSRGAVVAAPGIQLSSWPSGQKIIKVIDGKHTLLERV